MGFSFEVDAKRRPLGMDEMLEEPGVIADLRARLRRFEALPWAEQPIGVPLYEEILAALEKGQTLVPGIRLHGYHGYREARVNGTFARVYFTTPEGRSIYYELVRQAAMYDPRVKEANHVCFVFTVARLADLRSLTDRAWPELPEGTELAASVTIGGGTPKTNPAACVGIGFASDIQKGAR